MNTLEKLLKGLFMVLLMASMATLTSCDDDDDDNGDGGDNTPNPTKTIYQLVKADSDLSRLKAYIDADATLKAIAQGTTTHTLFAADNDAFDKLEETLGGSLDDVAPDIVQATMFFQFVAEDIASEDIADGSFTTLMGEDIVGNKDGTIATGGSDSEVEVLEADVLATNGRLHKIETILIPPTLFAKIGLNLGKLSQPLLLGKDFTILAEGIALADAFATENQLATISEILAGDDVYTVFAPTNATFDAADPAITGDTYTGQVWFGIISNHIVAGEVVEADLFTCETFATRYTADFVTYGELEIFFNETYVPADNGVGIYIDSNGDVDCTLSDSGASLTELNAEVAVLAAYEATNGWLHVIAGVLAP